MAWAWDLPRRSRLTWWKWIPSALGRKGFRLEKVVVQPEFDGNNWNDVLRVMIPQDQPAMDVRVKVYILKP